jgi:hypothetical protein
MSTSFTARGLCALALSLVAGIVAAQPAPWTEILPVLVTEHSGVALTEHQVPIEIDTQQLIAAGQMRADGGDLRFAVDQAGTQPIAHWIESGLNTATTRVWLRMPQIPASGQAGAYLFTGNPAATSTSTLAVFDYANDIDNSATLQTSNTALSGVADAQRGFRFSVTEEILMVNLGKSEPSNNPRTITLFDFTTQAILEQQQVAGPNSQWSYHPLPQPRWLAPGSQYVLEIFFPAGDENYYYGAAPTMNPRVTYHDMRYCNSCTPNTFPTSSLGGLLYGYVDFQFRTRKQASPQPTAAIGVATSTTQLTADADPADFGSTATLTATISASFDTAGSVTFTVDAATQCVAPVTANVATCAVNGLAVGAHPAEATYSGNPFVTGSVGALVLDVQAVPPGVPTGVAATPGDSQASIAFTPPAFDGGATLSFTAQCTDGVATMQASGAGSPIVVGGLANGTTYQCSVFASNSAGNGPASEGVPVTPVAAPGAPIGLVATAGDSQASLAFLPPASDGGSPITDYDAACTDGVATITGSGAASPIVVTGLVNGTNYSCTVTATNAIGTGPASNVAQVIPQGLPGAPTGVIAAPMDGAAQVSFTAPASDGGSAITTYTVRCFDGNTTTLVATGSASPLTVTPMINGTSYSCTVAATNGVGEGPLSVAVNVVPVTVPGAPTDLAATHGDSQATLTFVAPAVTGGSAIIDYTAACSDGNAVFNATAATSPITVTGLTNGTTYSCTVSARNDEGSSPPSSAVSVTPATVPGAPTAVTAAAGDAQAIVNFSAPASDGGSNITAFTASCTDGVNTLIATGPASPLTIAPLVNGIEYTCTVTATNAEGTGAASSPATVTPASVPGAPTDLAATAGNGSATLTFVAPASTGGSAIIDYSATCSDGVASFSATAANSPITVSGLSNGTTYSCSVTARNAEGSGPASAPASVVPVTVPGAPTAGGAASGNAQAVVSFAAPATNGGSAITSYTARCTDGTTTFLATGTASPLTVTGLTNGTTYSCTVTATNAQGEGAASAPMQITPQGAVVNAEPLVIPALGLGGLMWLALGMLGATLFVRRRG